LDLGLVFFLVHGVIWSHVAFLILLGDASETIFDIIFEQF